MGNNKSSNPRPPSRRNSRSGRLSQIKLDVTQTRRSLVNDKSNTDFLQEELFKKLNEVERIRASSKKRKTLEQCNDLRRDIDKCIKELVVSNEKNDEKNLDLGAIESTSFISQDFDKLGKTSARNSTYPSNINLSSDMNQYATQIKNLGLEIKEAITGNDFKTLTVLEKKVDILYGDLEQLKVSSEDQLCRQQLCATLFKYNKKIKKHKQPEAENDSNDGAAFSKPTANDEISNLKLIENKLNDIEINLKNLNNVYNVDNILFELHQSLDKIDKKSSKENERVVNAKYKVKNLLQQQRKFEAKLRKDEETLEQIAKEINQLQMQVENFQGFKNSPEYNNLDQTLRSNWNKLNDFDAEVLKPKREEISQEIQNVLKKLNAKVIDNAKKSLPKDNLAKQVEMFKYSFEQLKNAIGQKNIKQNLKLCNDLRLIHQSLSEILGENQEIKNWPNEDVIYENYYNLAKYDGAEMRVKGNAKSSTEHISSSKELPNIPLALNGNENSNTKRSSESLNGLEITTHKFKNHDNDGQVAMNQQQNVVSTFNEYPEIGENMNTNMVSSVRVKYDEITTPQYASIIYKTNNKAPELVNPFENFDKNVAILDPPKGYDSKQESNDKNVEILTSSAGLNNFQEHNTKNFEILRPLSGSDKKYNLKYNKNINLASLNGLNINQECKNIKIKNPPDTFSDNLENNFNDKPIQSSKSQPVEELKIQTDAKKKNPDLNAQIEQEIQPLNPLMQEKLAEMLGKLRDIEIEVESLKAPIENFNANKDHPIYSQLDEKIINLMIRMDKIETFNLKQIKDKRRKIMQSINTYSDILEEKCVEVSAKIQHPNREIILKDVENMMAEIPLIVEDINNFYGTTEDKEYFYLDDYILKMYLRLDKHEHLGDPITKNAIEKAMHEIQKLMKLLDEKVNSNMYEGTLI